MTAIETVWDQLKLCAADYARRGERPRRFRAEAIVIGLMKEARVAPWPPPRVIEFFTKEFLTMIDCASERDSASMEAAG